MLLGGASRPPSSQEMITSGFLGGLLSGFVCAPMELVMIQQQRHGQSLLATPAAIVRSTGTTGLFRGLTVSCGREAIFTAGYLGVGPAVKRQLREEGYGPGQAKAMSSIFAGVASATLSHPIDTVKTCMQARDAGLGTARKNLTCCHRVTCTGIAMAASGLPLARSMPRVAGAASSVAGLGDRDGLFAPYVTMAALS